MRFSNIQAASSVTLEDGTVLDKCTQCRQIWQERNDRGVEGIPICDRGEFCEAAPVSLLKENAIPLQVYQRIKSQVIFYYNGEADKEVDLNHVALWNMLDHWPVVINKWEVFNKVLYLYHTFLKERQDGGNS